MNILFIHEFFPNGGAEMVTMTLSAITRNTDKIYVLTNNYQKEKMPQQFSYLDVREVPYRSSDMTKGLDIKNLPFIVDFIVSNKIKVIFIPDMLNICPFKDELKKRTGCKIVYMCHSMPFWQQIAHKELFELTKERKLRKRTFWHPLKKIKYEIKYNIKLLKKLNTLKKQYLKMYKSVDLFTTLTDEYSAKFAERLNINLSTSKFRTLSNCYTCERPPHTPKKKEIYYIGRLYSFGKRPYILLKIWELIYKNFPEWSLKFVGEGEDLDKMKEYIFDNNIDRVEFLGYTNNPQQYYDRAAIVCLTSSYEGWPLVLTEAQANSCAAIAFDCCAGVRKILSPSWENGVLIEPNDINAYAMALSELMSNENLRNKIAKNGELAVKRFSPEKTLKEWNSILSELS